MTVDPLVLEVIQGKITQIHYRSDDFVIASFNSAGNAIKIKGSLYGVEKNEEVIVYGTWETHPKYGKQLCITRWERPLPNTKEQVIAFLASPLVKGCGIKRAAQLADALGENSIEIIHEQGEAALTGIKGIGKKRANQIVESIRSTFEVQKIVSALLVYGITANMAMKAYKEFGSDTLNILLRNPYKLVDLNLVGFLTADEIARKIGVMPISSYRIDSCVSFILKKKCYETGHCFIPEAELYDDVLLALNHNTAEQDKITREELQLSLYRLEEHSIIIEDQCVYPKFLYQYEDSLAENISLLINGSSNDSLFPLSYIEKLIFSFEQKNNMMLAASQQDAIKLLFLKEQLMILTGGPGTGKTTVTKGIIDVFRMVHPHATILLAAPTGRASRKLAEVTMLEASTIHRLLGFRQGQPPEYNAKNKLKCDLLVIDEMSMVDVQLACLLLEAVGSNTKVLFVGDVDQLPSVGPGNVLRDLIQAGIPTVKLTEVFRQAQESQIVTNAHRINKGMPISIDSSKNDFYFVHNENPEQIAQLIVLSVVRFLKLGYSLSDILVLSPMKKGACGTIALNERIRECINPGAPNKNELRMGSRLFREGDKIIQIKNNDEKDLSNGDIGIVSRIIKIKNQDGEYEDVIVCDFSGKAVHYCKEELKEIELAYCITVHKSQGGESPIVIIPVTTSHYVMLARNLMYTGLTRAKNIMVFVGCYKAMNMAIANDAITKRNSRLTERIIAYYQHHNRYRGNNPIAT